MNTNSQYSFVAVTACALAWIGTGTALADSVPTWQGVYLSGGNGFATQMVGEFPQLGHTTRIPVVLIPLTLKFNFGNITMDPNKPQQGHSDSPVSFTLKSPLFQAATFPNHPETVAAPTQYLDAYQRSNFWNVVTGGNPSSNNVKIDFHVLLNSPVVMPRTLDVPPLEGFVDTDSDGNLVGHVNWDVIGNQLDSLLVLSPSNALTIILMDNVILTNVGNAGTNAGGLHDHRDEHTFIVAGFGFSRHDVAGLGHELAEWLVDPFFTSRSPGWVTGSGECSHHMEVGDPLRGQFYQMQMHPGGPVFRLQDAAFEAWFARGEPSNAINGTRTFQALDLPNPPCQ